MTLTSDAQSRGRADSGGAPDTGDATRRGPLAVVLVAGVVGVVVLGVFFRFVARSPLWLDEALSVNIARLPWSDLHDGLKHDGAPPLYYALLHVWTSVFGTSDEAARSLSGLLGVATLPLAWFAGRRIGDRTTAWAAVLILALNPYALRYSTEARMYWLLALLVFAGILAFRRAFERPTLGRLALVAAVVAALVYTQYWSFYLLATTAALLLWTARREENRRASVRLLGAMAVGLLAFVPWLPTFAYQLEHTGTPWGAGRFLGFVFGKTFLDFAGEETQEGYLLWFALVALILLGIFARGVNGRHLDIDLSTQPDARVEAFLGIATLVAGGLISWLSDSAFHSRYAALVFPFFVLLAARGATCFTDMRIRGGVLSLVCLLGLAGAARNVVEDRTQLGQVADALRMHARPGDVVVYCPDQLGPAGSRLAPHGLVQVTYPELRSPQFVDWVDYVDVLKAADPAAVAVRVRARAGAATIFLVTANGYLTHPGTCESFANALAGTDRSLAQIVSADDDIVEKAGLIEIARR